jgi:ATP-dependent Clp protease, protease subunit
MRERLNKVLAEHTGQSVERIAEDTERDFWMNPEEARNYGLIDRVQVPRKRVAKAVNG